MYIKDYLTSENALWMPLNLDTSKGYKVPIYDNLFDYMPKNNDFINLKPEEIKAKQIKLERYEYGAADCRELKHIDVDIKEQHLLNPNPILDKALEVVEKAKSKYPYFLSSSKNLPHFLFRGDTESLLDRLSTNYKIDNASEYIEILNGGWSYFPLDGIIYNPENPVPTLEEIKGFMGLEIIVNKKKEENKRKIKVLDEGIESDEDKNEYIENLLDCIKNEGEGIHYDDYIRIIWGLRNHSSYNYNSALQFSSRSSKHDKTIFKSLWNKTKEGNTLGTVHYYAKKHNPDKYKKLYKPLQLKPTEEGLTKLFLELEGETVSYSNETIYLYKKEWEADCRKKLKLKSLIRTTLNGFIISLLEVNQHKEESQLHLNKIHLKLHQRKTIDNIAELLTQDLATLNLDIEFDTNREQLYNIQFNNGLYDLKKMAFRKRTKKDFITKKLKWDYDPNISKYALDEIKDFFRKLQPNEKQRRFSLGWLARCLDGNLGQSKFKMNIGYTAENGKSTEFNIHSLIFPIYSYKLSANFFSLDNSKRHKELIHLLRNPIRFSYIEELRQNKLDGDFLKEFSDGKINCEIMYGESITKTIQATLNTCANKDFNIDSDNGVQRRGVLQYYKSEFKNKYTEDNYKNNTFLKKLDYFKRYEDDDKLKNAYFYLLLQHYKEYEIPKENETLFNDIAEEYDPLSSDFNATFEITKDNNDILSKNEVFENLKAIVGGITWRKCLTELKNRGVEYDKAKMIKGIRGAFMGIKILDTSSESDPEELND